MVLDDLPLHLHAGGDLAVLDGQVVIQDNPALDGLPAVEPGVELVDVALDHGGGGVGRDDLGVRAATQSVARGPLVEPVRVEGDDRADEVALVAVHDELAGVGADGLEQPLDHLRGDVLAARRLEQVLLAVRDTHIALVVDLPDVAGVQPAVVERLGGGRLLVVVAGHHAGALDQQLAVVGDPELGAVERRPDRAELVVVRAVDAGSCGGLGEPVALEDQDSRGVEPLGDVTVERGGTRDEEAHPAAETLADLGEDEPVVEAVLERQRDRDVRTVTAQLVDLEPDREGPVEDLLLDAPVGLGHRDDPAMGLLEDAWCRTHERRPDDREVVDDLLHPAVDGGEEADRELGRQQNLAERVGQREPQELGVVDGEDPKRLDGDAFVGPRGVRQPDALGLAGRTGRVDQGCEIVAPGLADSLLDDVGLLHEQLGAERLEVVECDHPVAVALAVENDDFAQVGQLRPLLAELGDLDVVLGERDSRVGVGQDERHVHRHRGRVDRGGRRPRSQDGEVGEHPLVASSGGDGDSSLRLDSQGDQPRGNPADPFTRLSPGDRGPAVAFGVAVSGPRGRRRDPVEEHPPETRGTAVDQIHCLFVLTVHHGLDVRGLD